MRLPSPDDPTGDKVMTLPVAKVMEVLIRYGVRVTQEMLPIYNGDEVLLSKDEVEEVLVWDDKISGNVVKRLHRAFRIPIMEFYSDTPNPTSH